MLGELLSLLLFMAVRKIKNISTFFEKSIDKSFFWEYNIQGYAQERLGLTLIIEN